jgi:phage terminase large subunit
MGRDLEIETAAVFRPLTTPNRYKGAWGGRGSGKSHFFASLLIDDSLYEKGLRSVCIREVQKSLKDSAKKLIEDKLIEHRLGEADGFRVFRENIQTPGDGVITFVGMQDHTAESIKSLEGFKRAWCEEAQSLSARSLSLLRPTIRSDGSQLWFSWNPRRRTDPVDLMLRSGTLPTGAVVVRANWSDNPWFPKVLEQERLDCARDTPDQYEHIWEGQYATVISGAYYAQSISQARAQGRIGRVGPDPLMTYRAFWDIGGTSARSDACAIWIAQFVGREIRVLDYYEAVGQPLATHVQWLRSRGYEKALMVLPHDGVTHDRVYDVSYQSALRAAGFDVQIVPNQGAGAASLRVEAGRRRFPQCWFNESTTTGGLEALGWYHEKRDESRNIGLGPEHDWSSNGCFLGETEVLTRYGMRQIMNLPDNGEILTPCGWRPYINPRITRRNAPLVEVKFAGGYSVKCTPDHLFLTESGWKSAECLTPNTVIRSTLTRSRSISMAVSTVFGRATAICRAAARSCIETFGLALLGRFPIDATSTTGTETSSTIGLRTWSACRSPSIVLNRGSSEIVQKTDGFHPMRETRPPNGTHRPKEGFGTRGTQNAPRAGLSGSEKIGPASIAERFITRLSARVEILANIVRKFARLLPTANAVKATSGRAAIESVRRLSDRADVWDITVPSEHCFSLANGAVVHNSDAFGMMCVVYDEPEVERKRSVEPRNYEGSWLG